MQAIFAKMPNNLLMPVCNDSKRLMSSLRLDEGVKVAVYKVTDMRLHRKLFKLLELAFEAWDPNDDVIVIGESRRKDFDHFRESVLILAGHCDATYHSVGKMTIVARSLAVAECDGYDIERVYRAVLDVVWTRILRHVRYASPASADCIAEQLLTFD